MILYRRPISVMIVTCMTLHVWWAIMLFGNEAALKTTAINALHDVIEDRFDMIFWLLSASSCSLVGWLIRRPWAGILLIPQSVLLWLSAAGVLSSVFLGHFADGVDRAREFIAADQMIYVFLAAGHTAALILHVLWKAETNGGATRRRDG